MSSRCCRRGEWAIGQLLPSPAPPLPPSPPLTPSIPWLRCLRTRGQAPPGHCTPSKTVGQTPSSLEGGRRTCGVGTSSLVALAGGWVNETSLQTRKPAYCVKNQFFRSPLTKFKRATELWRAQQCKSACVSPLIGSVPRKMTKGRQKV